MHKMLPVLRGDTRISSNQLYGPIKSPSGRIGTLKISGILSKIAYKMCINILATQLRRSWIRLPSPLT